ncbi:ISL3 family transposase [Candidatus Poriferisodalis sp.]|uniref:ISL3 family transposase n=1 Tax=Candidatus Poriferisodalis sp. TaxID=3101277 RepID=UPI003AF5C90F
MNRDVMSVRLWLPRIRVLGVVADAPEQLVVRVCSTVSRPRCGVCGTPSGRTHDRRDREVRDLEVSGRPVTLVFSQRRMVCGPCGRRFVEDHRAFEGRVTARLARRLVADAREMTVNAAAKRHQVGWRLVNALVVAWAGVVGDHRRRRRCRVLLVEGTSIRKRHRYVTVLVNGDTGEVLAMVPHRDSAALSGFLAGQGAKWCRRVKVVVSDGSKAYKTAIDRRLGHARHVLDRFHVIRWFAAGLIAVRRDVQRRPEGSTPAFDRDVFGSRFLLMRRPDKLDAAERERLDKLFAAHPRLRAAWDALGELHQLYLAEDREGALAALDRFADIYGSGQIPEFSDTVDTFLAWHNEILEWHRTGRPSNGRIEGTILWSVSEGVGDVADGHMAGGRGRVLWSVSLESAMLLAA